MPSGGTYPRPSRSRSKNCQGGHPGRQQKETAAKISGLQFRRATIEIFSERSGRARFRRAARLQQSPLFRRPQVYLLLLLYIFRKPADSKYRDSVSQKNSRPQLAAHGGHAGPRDFWGDRHL